MTSLSIPIEKLTPEQIAELLMRIVKKLDELDGDDFFGSEGWRHMFGLED